MNALLVNITNGGFVTSRLARIIMVGPFPPPVNGMAAVNAAVRDQFAEAGVKMTAIDLAADRLDRSLPARLSRIPKIIRGLVRLMFASPVHDGKIYMSVSGGFGQIYEVLFLLLARLRRFRLYLHHHSFDYLDRGNRMTRLLTSIAGPGCKHITLSPHMAAYLKMRYPAVRCSISVSNTVFFAGVKSKSDIKRHRLQTIGFISNISEEKGIFEFLDLVAACEAEGLAVKARLAGPFQDYATENQVRQRLEKLDSVDYVGPQYGADKDAFFHSIDALIFPTRYVNEAEPLVIHEAMQHALPVIAYGRGCIPEIVGFDCGLVIDPNSPFVPACKEKIKQWLDSPDAYRSASCAAGKCFSITLEENLYRWNGLFREMLDCRTDTLDSVSTSEKPSLD